MGPVQHGISSQFRLAPPWHPFEASLSTLPRTKIWPIAVPIGGGMDYRALGADYERQEKEETHHVVLLLCPGRGAKRGAISLKT
jgi:hypothetical protein